MDVTLNGTTDVLSLKVPTCIGTNGAGGFCGSHSNAVGLRLYFDASNHPASCHATFVHKHMGHMQLLAGACKRPLGFA